MGDYQNDKKVIIQTMVKGSHPSRASSAFFLESQSDLNAPNVGEVVLES